MPSSRTAVVSLALLMLCVQAQWMDWMLERWVAPRCKPEPTYSEPTASSMSPRRPSLACCGATCKTPSLFY